jgi:sporulation protein YlmC with PRC-barrel domain
MFYTQARMSLRTTARVSLTSLLGVPVTDASGKLHGHLKDIAVFTGTEAGRVAGLILKTREGKRIVHSTQVIETPAGNLELRSPNVLQPLAGDENFLFLRQDLIDRQIIDIHGRKVVRVNDVVLEWLGQGSVHLLRVAEVEVGLRGALQRVFKGLLPRRILDDVVLRVSTRTIPWHFVDVIEVDPARRVKLRIEHERLANLHPSDLAEILADLAPAEREAIFNTLDEEVAAEALEEVDPKLQKSLLESLDKERIADIVEEMDPAAAADLLNELPDERSEAILEEMEPEERHEVEELLEFDEDSAAGRMTTAFVAVPQDADCLDAVQALRDFDGDQLAIHEIYLLDEAGRPTSAVPVSRILIALPTSRLSALAEPSLITCNVDVHQNEVAELFDKYNLHSLPVVNAEGALVGIVHADQVIHFLFEKL